MSTHLFRLLAEATLAEKLFDALTVTIVGMGIVFVSLWFIGEIFTLLHRLIEPREPASAGEDDAQFAARTEGAASNGVNAHLVPILIAAAG
jgi:Na+-transporting methylmalonyl-CoA/oxaloacetate decarboxylase gamma subunit